MFLMGITPTEFKVLYLVGISGIVLRFLFNLGYGVWWDTKTPNKFQFKYFVKGLARIIVSLGIMAIVIARFQELSPYLVDIEFTVPVDLGEGNKATAGITVVGALLIGSGIDDVVKRVMSRAFKNR